MDYEIHDFKADVIDKSHEIPVLVDFWAPWCAPCRMLGPILERLAEKHRDAWVLAKVNTDKHQDIALQYNISGIPQVKLFFNGSPVAEFTGAMPQPAIEQWLKKSIPGESDRKLSEAQQLLVQGQPELAEVILREIVNKEPENIQARILLAHILVFQDPRSAIDMVSMVKEHDPYFDIANALLVLAGLIIKSEKPELISPSPAKSFCLQAVTALKSFDFDHALDFFIEALKADRKFNDECARKACIAIFKYLGEENPVTKKHRRAFGASLY